MVKKETVISILTAITVIILVVLIGFIIFDKVIYNIDTHNVTMLLNK
jgi:hypothetical protein